MSPKCLYEEPDRTLTVRKQKEKDTALVQPFIPKLRAQNKSTAES